MKYHKDEVIKLKYTNYKGETTIRNVHILGIHFGQNEYHKEYQYLLRTFDLDKNNVRTFALKNCCFEYTNKSLGAVSNMNEHNEKEYLSSLNKNEKKLLSQRFCILCDHPCHWEGCSAIYSPCTPETRIERRKKVLAEYKNGKEPTSPSYQ